MILTIISLAILGVLISLGNWQYGRYQFKLALEKAAPAPFLELVAAKSNPQNYQKFHLKGKSIGAFVEIETSQEGKYGSRVFTILETDIGKVFYELGFIEGKKESHNAAIAQQLTRPIRADVVLRISEKPNRYIPENKPSENHIFWPQIAAMEQLIGQKADFANFYFTPITQDPLGLGKVTRNPFADPKGAAYVEPARHLGYALTWWGLAIGLIGVYIALHIKNGRLSFKPK